ncbi:MAG: 2-dehydropantoate 2-reductase [Nitrospinota bacterium]|nr:MAG: 2-dehydropantoate 2-reductase [Nitrospinota bacterium]
MRFVIIGAGAVGGVLGAHLFHGGEDVVLVDPAEHIETIRRQGLHLKGRYGDFVVHIPAVRDIAEVTPQAEDILCLAVKQYHTAEALPQLRRVYDAGTPLFCFQNTVENEEMALQHFQRVYGVVVRMGAKFVTPGEVSHLGGNSLTIGRYPGGIDETVETVATHLRNGGFQVHLHPEIVGVKWYKLFLNLSNSIHAIFGLSSAESPNDPECRKLRADLLEESLAVVKAAGIPLHHVEGEPPIETLIQQLRQDDFPVREVPADPAERPYPSMWQDLYWQRGKTEVQALNGKIAALGRRVQVPTPINDLLVRLVEEMVSKGEKPGKYTIAQFRDMLSSAT